MNRSSLIAASLVVLLSTSGLLGADDGFSLFKSRKPNLVIVLMDTLRADHLGVYGYRRDTSPKIDQLARRGMVFSTAYSVANWTNPTIKSMFTGLSPQSVMRAAKHDEAIRMPLPDEVTTFAELFRTNGYRTAGLMDHPGLGSAGGYAQGFEFYSMMYKDGSAGGGAWDKSDVGFVVDQFGQRLDEYGDDPFLIYVHVVYPHRRYSAPPPFKGMFGPDDYERHNRSSKQAMINAYDAEIRRTDDMVGRLHQELASRSLLADTWLVLTADHGEAFWEHDLSEHGNALYNEAIQIPLVVVPPLGNNIKGSRIKVAVSNLDVFPTILDIAGIDIPEGTMGLSLKDNDSPGHLDANRALFSESPHSMDIEARAVIRNGYKYVDYPNIKRVRHELYNLRNDRREFNNLYAQQPDLAAELMQLIHEHMEQSETERAWLAQKLIEPDEATLEGLRSLGYIQ